MNDRPYIYVASSWRNVTQPRVVLTLRDLGYGVYDFRHPGGEPGFAWTDISDFHFDPQGSEPWQFTRALAHPLAVQGFRRDFEAMQRASIFVMVLPCERDAHLELGWAAGAGKETIILLDNPCKASLMYGMVDHISPDLPDLVKWLS